MEALTGTGISILAMTIALWLITSKQTRKSWGNSASEASLSVEQAIKVSRAEAFKDAKAELGDVQALLNESDAFLSVSK